MVLMLCEIQSHASKKNERVNLGVLQCELKVLGANEVIKRDYIENPRYIF